MPKVTLKPGTNTAPRTRKPKPDPLCTCGLPRSVHGLSFDGETAGRVSLERDHKFHRKCNASKRSIRAKEKDTVSVLIDLPWPPASLNPNRARSLHWSARHKAAKEYRWECSILAKAMITSWITRIHRFLHPLPLPAPVTATVTFYMPNRRRRDLDNLLAAMKPAWDGLVDAGLLADDNADQLTITLKPPEYGRPAGVRLELAYNGRDDGDV